MDNNINPMNLFIAIITAILIMLGWQYFYENPKRLRGKQNFSNENLKTFNHDLKFENTTSQIKIRSESLSGSINLRGLRFDNLTLLKYNQNIEKDSEPVSILFPSFLKEAYFVEVGWLDHSEKISLPDSNTLWSVDKDELSPEQPLTFIYDNKKGLKFFVHISLAQDYLFNIKQTVVNNTGETITLQSYALINRNYYNQEKHMNILHQGPIGVIDNQLKECSYNDVKNKPQKFSFSKVEWLGITDKYWLVAIIPDKLLDYKPSFNSDLKNNFDKYQVDFISQSALIKANSELTLNHKLFAGAKKVDLLDKYEKMYDIKLFDRAIDFGWFYILTKPVFNTLNFFYYYTGNFGVSILLVTVIIKLFMFTLANKSYYSMKKIKNLQPEIDRIKDLHSSDKIKLNQEIMELYRREKVNPVSGCLPLLIQIPVFFSIYKVLYVTIEMRHARFFGWIKDLSAPDPTTIFNLFGLLPFQVPNYLMIGAWPIIMAITMYLQQKMNPEPADPIQAQLMKFMPILFLIMFNNFPAGLLIYWSWNNILSIVQQYYVNNLKVK